MAGSGICSSDSGSESAVIIKNHAVPKGAAFFIGETMKLSPSSIIQNLKVPDITVETYDSLPSTNTLAKERARAGAPHGLVIAAAHQTAGRGRMGREFYSPADSGIYFSVLLRPTFSPQDCLLITTAAAVACARVLDCYTEHPVQIKWVNDLYVNNKKICGILTEASFKSEKEIDYAILGIGINLTPPKDGFPDDILHKAGVLLDADAPDLRGQICAEVINAFFDLYHDLTSRTYVTEYQSRSYLDGKAIDVIKNDGIIPGTAVRICDDLTLLVRYSDGTTEQLSTGDVSIRNIK